MIRESAFVLLMSLILEAQQIVPSKFDLRPIIGQSNRGDGGLATSAVLDAPAGVAQDADGNVYIAESGAGVIRKVRAADGVIERFAGGGVGADSWAGRSALETNIYTPTILLISRDGKSLLFADSQNCRIRVIREDGAVADVAGSGRCSGSGGGFPGGGGSFRDRPALETDLGIVGGMAFDAQGRLLFTEPDLHLLRRMDADGYVRSIAGIGVAGSSGDGAEAVNAALNTPRGVVVDAEGTIYLADSFNCRVRKITNDGNISVAAGANACATSTATYNGGSRTALDRTGALAYDTAANVLYMALPRVNRVVRWDIGAARITPFLGNGRTGVTDTTSPLGLTLNEPSGLLVASDGSLLATAIDSFQAYRVMDGIVSTFAGRWPQSIEYASAEQVPLVRPQGILLMDGVLLLADSAAGRIMRYDSASGTLIAVAGMAYPSGYDRGLTGPALEATLREPNRLAQGPDGSLYFTERTRIRAINAEGMIRTVLDSLDNPAGLAFDGEGRLWYAESGQHRVMRLEAGSKTPTLVAGTSGRSGFSGDGDAATNALLNAPGDVVFDAAGNLLIADRGNYRVRSLSPDGKIRTIAGSGLTFNYSDMTGISASDAGFGTIDGLTVDAQGNIYISEQMRVDRITPEGKVEILTGLLSEADDGSRTYLDGPLNGAGAIAVDNTGRIYLSVRQDGRLIAATPK